MLYMIVLYVLHGALFGSAARRVSEYRGEPDGFWWGFILGAVGLLIVIFRKPSLIDLPVSNVQSRTAERKQTILKKNCPSCGALNNAGNTACFACGKTFEN